MAILYYLQTAAALFVARTSYQGTPPIYKALFNKAQSIRLIPTVIAILVLPLALAWVPGIPALHTETNQLVFANIARVIDIIVFEGSVSLLVILITIEISLLFTTFTKRIILKLEKKDPATVNTIKIEMKFPANEGSQTNGLLT